MKYLLTVLTLILVGHACAQDKIPDLVIKKIEKGVYLHQSFSQVEGFGLVSANGLVIIDEDKAFIIDTPWSEPDTEKLVKWIEKKKLKLVGSISTHSHEDRTAGINWLNAHTIPTYASALTNQILKAEGKDLAIHTIEDMDNSFFGGYIDTFYPGAGHAIDNIVVWLPQSKILFGGCLVKSIYSKTLGYTGDASIGTWPHSVEKVHLKYPEAKLVIPGHGKYGGIQLLDHTKKLAEAESVSSAKIITKPIDIVNARMDAYNKHDINAFLETYSEEIQIFDYPNTPIGKKGKAHIKMIFAPMFDEGKIQVKIHHQITQGNYVINHETVMYGDKKTKYVSIYEIKNGLIESVQFVRE
jgi:metallo-beta-lactamase class B/metallo-beta-lactamase class B GIM